MLDCLLLASLMLQVRQAPSPPPKPAAGTAVIRGQITDQESGVPISRASVTLRVFPTPPIVITNIADNDGRFEFLNLPAGRYEISATAGEHRATHLRQSFSERPLPPGASAPILLRDGEARTNVNIALRRTLAISGRVVDEYGEPLSGVSVALSAADGGPGILFGGSQSTDDRGMFRIFGVLSGRYVLCAQAQLNSASRNVISSATTRFVTTCHPSTLTESEAEPVTVSNADVDGIEIVMRQSRSFSISGMAVHSTGAPAEFADIALVRYRRDGASSSGSQSLDGRFLFSDLAPGDYAIRATIGRSAQGAADAAQQEHGEVPVRLSDSDVEGLVVAMKKAATVHGRVIFEDTPPVGLESGALTISLRADSRSVGMTPNAVRPARVAQDRSFALTGLFGRQKIVVDGVPRGWVVKAIRYRGQDISDIATEFDTDPKEPIEITLTSRTASVGGTVTDDSGKPAARGAVILLPADPQRWGNELSSYPIAYVMPQGRFALPVVRAGDYLIIAIASDRLQALSRERATAERVAKYAERASLLEHDKLTIDLRVADIPERR